MSRQRVPNLELAADTARANLLVNGGFEIWQRGTSFSAAAYGPDRWALQITAPDALTVTRESATVDIGSQYAALVTAVKNGAATPPALTQIPNDLAPQMRGRMVTCSVRVRGSTANSVRLRMNDGVTGAQYSGYHSGGGGWETLSMSYAMAANGNAANVAVEFNLSGNYWVDNAMLVVGSVPADYMPLHPADDLARCQRYYEVMGESAGELARTGYHVAANQDDMTLTYHVRKAVQPTVTKTGAWTVANCAQPATVGYGINAVVVRTTITATGQFSYNNSPGGCAFIAEANP